MPAADRAQDEAYRSNQAGETEQRRRGKGPQRMDAHEPGDARGREPNRHHRAGNAGDVVADQRHDDQVRPRRFSGQRGSYAPRGGLFSATFCAYIL